MKILELFYLSGMTDEFYTGQWTGYYQYGRTYGDKEGERCEFRVELTVKDGELSGEAFEEVTEKHMGAPATISGFIEGAMISMIKQYPFYYQVDEKGGWKIDRTRKHPSIHYTGYFDPATETYSGEWDIEKVVERDFFGDESLHIASGFWEMRKGRDPESE